MVRNARPSVGQPGLYSGQVPHMPEGYYCGDRPNPNLRTFVEQHLSERPYDMDTDHYDVVVFERELSASRSATIYGIHPYHQGKKAHDSIEKYIRHYTEPGDIVLDPMCGSGSTALASLLAGRVAVAIDVSPAATFIASRYCTPVDVPRLTAAFDRLMSKARPVLQTLYSSTCPTCGGPAETQYVVWSERYECIRCPRIITLYECLTIEVQVGAYPGYERGQGQKKEVSICPYCQRQPISTRSQKHGMVPVEISVRCLNGCTGGQIVRKLDGPSDPDYLKAVSPSSGVPQRWVPSERFSEWAQRHDGLASRGVNTVADFFTKRNLLALAEIFYQIERLDEPAIILDGLKFAFTASLMSTSKKAQHLEEGGGYIPGNFHIPPMIKERNVANSMNRVFTKMIAGLQEISGRIQSTRLLVSTQSATDLSAIPSASIDYIFTDPPYGGAVQYGELNIIWEAWLGFKRDWLDEEIIVNPVRGRDESAWQQMMTDVLSECYRVLKPGRAMSICYHDASAGTWTGLMDAAARAGFLAEQTERALTLEMQQKTFNQSTSKEVVKRDLVVTFRKPSENLDRRIFFSGLDVSRDQVFDDLVLDIVAAQLTMTPGMALDRLYDIVVSRLVRVGRMQKHDFRALVQRIAGPADDAETRWFLNQNEDASADETESAREEGAARIIGAFIEDELREHPEQEGVHYSDIFEQYINLVRIKPRRQLQDWLLDYFFTTSDGTYRLPASPEEDALKAENRLRGTSRSVRRYLAYLSQGLPVPASERPSDSTLVEWIRHCKRSAQYEQGKLLYEKGGLNLDALPEETMVGVEEDYQVCVRMLARSAMATDSGPKGSTVRVRGRA